MTEAELQAAIIDAARMGGWLVFHPTDMRRNNPGFPDLVLVRAPDVLFLELKSDTGRVRPEQRVWLEELGECYNVGSALVRPEHLERVQNRLLRSPGPTLAECEADNDARSRFGG